MAMGAIGSSFAVTAAAPAGTGSSASAGSAVASPAGSIARDAFASATRGAAGTVVKAQSFMSNLWDMLFGPLLNSLFGSLFHGL